MTLAGASTITRATASWLEARPLAPYTLQARTAGAWRTVATLRGAQGDVDTVAFDPVVADAVRLRLPTTRLGGENPRLAELSVGG